VSASIAVVGDRVAVVNPDQGSVSLLDRATLEQKAVVDVGGEPHALLPLTSGLLLVSNHRGGEVVTIDVAAAAVRARRPACAGVYGMAEAGDGSWIAVTCEWDGRLLKLDPATLNAHVIASGLTRPRAVAVRGDEAFVAEYTGGKIQRIAADGSRSATSLVPASAPYRPAVTRMTANLASAVVPAFGGLYVTHELVNNTGDGTMEKVADDYGSVLDGNPKINPALTALRSDGTLAPDAPLYARFDGGSKVFNGPSAVVPYGERHLLVSHESTANVALIDARTHEVEATVAVGVGPMGIAVDGDVAFVDNAFDGSVSRVDLRDLRVMTLVRPLPQTYSAAALAGRKVFHDATNRHLTPSGVVACSTCHPSGGDDGLVWFMHTSHIPLKRRRTPHLGNAHSPTAPFHWDAEFPTMGELVEGTVVDLMAGDGLLLDTDAVRAYIDEIVRPPLPPAGDAAAIERGRAVFEAPETGCQRCHGGADFTDDQSHDVLDPLMDDDRLAKANTPSLRGLFLRAPYFHDGRSPTLRDLLTRGDASRHGTTSHLSPSQIDHLASYLGSL